MKYKINPTGAVELRQMARERLAEPGGAGDITLTEPQVQRLLEDLAISNIELEIQTQHLQDTRARLEMALTQSADLYDFAPVGFFNVDAQGVINKLNLMGAYMLGQERGELLGCLLDDFLEPQEGDSLAVLLARAERTGEPQRGIFSNLVETSLVRQVQADIAAAVDGDGGHITLTDITALKAIEQKLREDEERWQLALEATGVCVWDWKPQSGELKFSPTLPALYGFSAEEFGASLESWRTRVHPEDQSQLLSAIQHCLSGPRASLLNEHRVQCKDGSWKWIHCRGAVISKDTGGQATRLVGVHADISGRKRREQSLSALDAVQDSLFDALAEPDTLWGRSDIAQEDGRGLGLVGDAAQTEPLAPSDALTGALSRPGFLRVAEREFLRATRYQLPLMLLVMDLDGFKSINNGKGIAAGDAVLKGFADALRGMLRGSDTLGRIGADEFALLMPNTTLDGGRALALRVATQVAASPVEVDGKTLPYSVSIGGRCLQGETSFPDLLKRADAAMHQGHQPGSVLFDTSGLASLW